MFDCEFCCFLLSCRPLLSFFFSFKFLCGLRFAFSALCDACVVLVLKLFFFFGVCVWFCFSDVGPSSVDGDWACHSSTVFLCLQVAIS